MPKRTNKPGLSTTNRFPRSRGGRGGRGGYRGRGGGGYMRRPRYIEHPFVWRENLCISLYVSHSVSHTFVDFAAYESCYQDISSIIFFLHLLRSQRQIVLGSHYVLTSRKQQQVTYICRTCYSCFYLQGRIQRARFLLFSLLISFLHHLPPQQ